MDQSEIVSRVNATLRDGFEIPVEKLVPESTLFGDLGLDSLDAIDMLVYIEENLSVKVQGEVFKEVRTLGDIYRLVENLSNSPESKIQ